MTTWTYLPHSLCCLLRIAYQSPCIQLHATSSTYGRIQLACLPSGFNIETTTIQRVEISATTMLYMFFPKPPQLTVPTPQQSLTMATQTHGIIFPASIRPQRVPGCVEDRWLKRLGQRCWRRRAQQ
ncbi:hypothetical protein C8R43DRAFT_1018001 [Mycena crocata]|nr:hypothetical protein C8R43DRAFT_1018001 [Mycena crocata]